MRMVPAQIPITADDLHWNDLANRPRSEDLPRLRASAERWRTTLASLTGVFGIATVLAAPRAAADMAPAWKAVVGVILLFVLTMLIGATWCAGLAAQGRTLRVRNSYDEFRMAWLAEESRAIRYSRFSRIMALHATAALAVAIGLAWFSPIAPIDYLIIDRGATRQCLPVYTANNVNIALDAQTRVSIGSTCTAR